VSKLETFAVTRRTLLLNGGRLGGAAMLAGLGLSGRLGVAAAADAVTLDFPFLWTGPEGDALLKVVDTFNTSQSGIKVNGVSNPDQQRQLAAMSGSKGFDISDSFGGNVGAWASKGILEPLDDRIKKDNYDLTDFVPAALDQQKYDGKLYALPIAAITTALLYNEALLTEAGIAGPPKTTSELADAIAKLTKVDSNGNITQLGLNQPSLSDFAFLFGGEWANDKGEPTPDNPGNIAALNFWVDTVVKKYGVDQIKKFQSGFGEYASPQNPFYTGKVAMTIDGAWQIQFIKEYAPQLKWGAGMLPYVDDKPELAGVSPLTTGMFFIPRNSKHSDEAWTFLKYLVDKPAMLDFTLALANLPARLSLLDDPKVTALPNVDVWLEALRSPNLKSFPNASWAAEYQNELTSSLDAVTNLKKTPEEAMAELAKKMKQIAG
jgi:multiple sugar transport system substrate-binding protein